MWMNCITEAKIQLWFNLFKILEIKAIRLENRYNKDKASIIKGLRTNGLMVRTFKYKALKKKKAKGCTLTSFIKYISATSRFLLLFIIFKGKSV